ILGYPGRTTRYRTSIETAFALDYSYPQSIAALDAGIKGMEEAYKNDKGLEIEYASIVKSYMNTIKNFQGNVAGMSKNGLIEEKKADEKAFMDWVNKDPKRKAKYGNLLSDFETWYKKLEGRNQKNTVLQWMARARWYNLANGLNKTIVKQAGQPMTEEAKKAFIESNLATFGDLNVKIEKFVFRNNATIAFTLPESQSLSAFSKGALSADEAASKLAESIVTSLKIGDTEGFTALLNDIAAGKSPENEAIKLADFLGKELAVLTAFTTEFNRNLTELRRLLIEGMMAFKGKDFYPDANSTIRFSYGTVKAYNPRDAVSYDYITRFKGVIEKESGEEPFNNPKKLLELYKTKDYGSYLDKKLGDVPVAFLTTNDITGGNSGSPVLNGNGELIGCAFDGVWEALTGDWKFEDSNNRTIAVDSRYVLFILDKFSCAKNILDELTIVK
ncbi:MAG: S46 family peptidase, partial [Bacteroidetes bacterium]|nr:S46 family peptidase [Bacteroidota bacterium]